MKIRVICIEDTFLLDNDSVGWHSYPIKKHEIYEVMDDDFFEPSKFRIYYFIDEPRKCLITSYVEKKYFIPISEYRDKQIDNILNED